MKVKNRNGIIVQVPDTWTAEELREKNLIPITEKIVNQPPLEKEKRKSSRKKKPRGKPVRKNYLGLSLEQLKSLARERGIRPGRKGKDKLIELLSQEEG